MIKQLTTFLSCLCAAWTFTAAANDLRLETLGKADDERVAAIIAADPARLAASFSDDLSYAHSTGVVDGKASYIDLLVSGRTKYMVYDYEERTFTFPSPGIALMTGRVHIKSTSATGVSDGVLSILAVWREEQGQWRFLAWQSCKLPPPAPLLPSSWNAKQAADKVMERLVKVTAPQVKGAHDAEFVCVGDLAFIVTEANDVQPSENPEWPFFYVALSVVNLKTMALEKVIPIAHGEQKFENETLPTGACYVPRIIQKDARTLRCYFASEEPTKRQSQTWFIDFDMERMAFENRIHRAKIKTTAGTFDMQPQFFHADAAAGGFKKPARDFGLHLFDSFKKFDGRTYVALNNFPGGQNALAVVNEALDTFEIIGHYNEPQTLRLSESAVNRLPDGTWMAVCRQDGGNGNYTFTTSKDGKTWTRGEHRDFVPNGGSSKPTFDKFGGLYYLGWQERTKINGVGRSVFNVDVSSNGKTWEHKYRFETEKSFQYPAFHEHNSSIWLSVTQGDTDSSHKERIMFGKLEDVGQFAAQAGSATDPSMLNISPGADAEDSARTWQGIPGIERAPNGRLWAIWYSGALSEGMPGNYCVVATSGDDGKTWSKPVLLIKGPTPKSSTFDAVPWLDPKGRLWFFYVQYTRDLNGKTTAYGTYAVRTDSPDEVVPKWSTPFLVFSGGRIFGKPIHTASGDWLAPLYGDGKISEKETGVLVSKDEGGTWRFLGGTSVPKELRNFSEHTLAQRKNGDLWMVIRTMTGLSESTSTDGGRTWSDPMGFHDGPNTRAHVRRLASGAFLLVYHDLIESDQFQLGPKSKPMYPRSKIAVWLSDDEGRTWPHKLLLDARNCSYPDATQAPDGRIYVAYDCWRYGCRLGLTNYDPEAGPGKEIAMAVIREEDIRAGKIVSSDSRLRQLINRATGYGNAIELKNEEPK